MRRRVHTPRAAMPLGAAGLLAAVVAILLVALVCAGCGSTAAGLAAAAGDEAPVTPATGQTTADEAPAAAVTAQSTARGLDDGPGSGTGGSPAATTLGSGAATSATKLGSVERAREPFTGGAKTKGQYARGTVLGSDGKPVEGATVSVVINAADPLYETDDGRLVGKATTDAAGRFRVSLAALPLGTIVDVSAVKRGYASVLVYGTYDERVEQIDFKDFGAKGGDRRLPVGDQMPPVPFENLLPD